MDSNIFTKILNWLKIALRDALMIAAMLLLCYAITRDNFAPFSVGLFLPLASFTVFAVPGYTGKHPASEIVIGVAEIIAAHLICASWSAEKLLYILLYLAAGVIGFTFGAATRKLSKK
ncbi:MAG: hypothetical protein K6G89_07455 [Clostridia bacterium]|nr:hypothetical protein [Clostridia bacterium]